LLVNGPRSVTVGNVLIGDVWLASGQSNMEMGIGEVQNAAVEIAAADFPQIRLFNVPRTIALEPESRVDGRWLVCRPESLKRSGFSAVAYFFGRELHRELKVPIGLIHASWGGTVAEAWTSAEALRRLADFRAPLDDLDRARAGRKRGAGRDPNSVTVLFNGMIAPLVPFAVKGVIWYQGESNVGRADQYRRLLPALIADWRGRFGVGEFPFLIVQLANFLTPKPEPAESTWAELREAQWLTVQPVPKTGLAVAIDIGETGNIHPKNKQEVGRRLALAAEAIAYGKPVEFSGPTLREATVRGRTIRLSFDHLGGGLAARDGGPLRGFAIAGSDGQFVWASAVIDGAEVVVSAPEVAAPLAVRYAWAENPVCNLINKAGLPAVPFRTDRDRGLNRKRTPGKEGFEP
jgi:sialate O-acetylesterase